jgi:hypothetical protein
VIGSSFLVIAAIAAIAALLHSAFFLIFAANTRDCKGVSGFLRPKIDSALQFLRVVDVFFR